MTKRLLFMKKPIAVTALVFVCISTQAFASCGDDVDAFAAKYHAQVAVPDTGVAGTMSDNLKKDGGVITPPPTGDMATASPAVPNPDPMMTAPAIQPQVSGKTEEKSVPDAAATNAQLSSLLDAARQSAKSGNEKDCQQRLTQAMKIVADKDK